MREHNQFGLLRTRRFAPYFVTQVLGAFNDNLYKNALVALIAFIPATLANTGLNQGLLINLCAGLFILPFFLFSAIAGQVADKVEKATLIRRIKLFEIVIVCFAAVALLLNSLVLMIAVLFLLGVQSAFFGPVKFGILPQHLDESELVGGNGLVELGTFLAILVGTIVGTQLILKTAGNVVPIIIATMLVALVGYFASRKIPIAEAGDPSLKINFNSVSETVRLIRYTHKNRIIFQAILGISWFWFMGATYLAQFPVYASDVLGGSGDVFTLLLALFSIGIATGSALCEKLSDGLVEIGLVPFGVIGITLFGLDLYFATPNAPLGDNLGLLAFLSAPGAWRLCADIIFIGMFGGFYIVPLYALIQQRSHPEKLSRAIACNSVMNAIFMVLSALVAGVMISLGFSIAQMFLGMAIMNAMVAIYIFRLVPEFLMRFLIWLLIHTMYRVRKIDLRNIPEDGAVILTCNHVSFVDALIVGGCIKRPVRFVMYYKIFSIPVLNFIFRTARAIPIAGAKEDKAMFDQAFVEMNAAMQAGEVLCIFPEGQITHDGQMNPFKQGVMKVLEKTPVPVVPMALQGLWGSMFSRKGGKAFAKLPRRFNAKIALVVGEPIAPDGVTLEVLEQETLALRGDRL
jgi:1-acyl-sn-glycerol-3-phosphate acyltransferase